VSRCRKRCNKLHDLKYSNAFTAEAQRRGEDSIFRGELDDRFKRRASGKQGVLFSLRPRRLRGSNELSGMIEKLFRFHGGIHPPGHKSESITLPIAVAPLAARLTVPLGQHAGKAAKPLVKPGSKVLKGQLIGEPDGALSGSIHAPTSGVVIAVEKRPVPHASSLPDDCVVIDADGEDRSIEMAPLDYRGMPRGELIDYLHRAGIAGLGGAAFPSAIKLRSAHSIATLVINGCECEPFITCDDLQMRERAADIVRGIEILQLIVGARELLIGIEDNKPEALAAMHTACARSAVKMQVVAVPTIYPSGGAKQLIRILAGVEIPAGKHAPDFGIQCFNTGTAFAVHRAVNHGEPLISRVVTVAGNVEQPRNFEVRIGTPFSELLALAGERAGSDGYIMGGPLMGVRVPSQHVPVVKGTICILAASPKLFPDHRVMPCIRCGMCAQACPVELQPHELYWLAKNQQFEKAAQYALADCIECGACSYVCPSHIPLVQYYKHAKSELKQLAQQRAAANQARERFEVRQLRLASDNTERTDRAAPAHAREHPEAAPAAQPLDPKQAAIQTALERARARQDKVSKGGGGHNA
jgi:Na+-translocating ferredoxin:NAD+ oxidoreductase subunit C